MIIPSLLNKRIVLGVTGSIACYKSIDLASRLTQSGALIDAILSDAAQRFVGPLSFRSVTGREVYIDMWDISDHVRHVRLGEAADLLVIAPITAHTLAKLAHGLADNLLTVTALAARCPVLVAPAMDGAMYEHPATQANVRVLQERGVAFAGPVVGRMASGLSGTGRMVEPAELVGLIRQILGHTGPLAGRNVVVTAGPTLEPIDPVRFLSNRSSGKQGLALAQAALDAGGSVLLITGPVQEPIPVGAEHIQVQSAIDMRDAVISAVKDADALLMAAAVADYRPAAVAEQKIKKREDSSEIFTLQMVGNPDILEEVKKQKQQSGKPTIVLGFAAETENALVYGREKLIRKGLDLIAINDVSAAGAGFMVDTNRVILMDAEGSIVELPLQSKAGIAESIIETVVAKLIRINDLEG